MSMTKRPALVGVKEIARRLGLSEARCYQLVKDGAIPCIRLSRSIKFDPQVIEQWLSNGGARCPVAKEPDEVAG